MHGSSYRAGKRLVSTGVPQSSFSWLKRVVRSEVLTVPRMTVNAFGLLRREVWLQVYRCFRGVSCLRHQDHRPDGGGGGALYGATTQKPAIFKKFNIYGTPENLASRMLGKCTAVLKKHVFIETSNNSSSMDHTHGQFMDLAEW
jgi:hypothetical protein